jgi:hypothetical protein
MNNEERKILEELIAAGNAAKLKLEKLDRIRVPEGIEFTEAEGKFGMGLIFNDRKQCLVFGGDGQQWAVGVLQDDDTVSPLYLEPCKREDLKPGDWAYSAWGNEPHFTALKAYNLILDDGSTAFVSGSGKYVIVKSVPGGNWWKVVQ